MNLALGGQSDQHIVVELSKYVWALVSEPVIGQSVG